MLPDGSWPVAASERADLNGWYRGIAAVGSAKVNGSNGSIASPNGWFRMRFRSTAIARKMACPNVSFARLTIPSRGGVQPIPACCAAMNPEPRERLLRACTDANRVIQPLLRILARRKFELRVLQRGADVVARFLDFGFRQPDQIERRQTATQMDFDGDERRIDAGETTRQHNGE